jgi:hypothetical protein
MHALPWTARRTGIVPVSYRYRTVRLLPVQRAKAKGERRTPSELARQRRRRSTDSTRTAPVVPYGREGHRRRKGRRKSRHRSRSGQPEKKKGLGVKQDLRTVFPIGSARHRSRTGRRSDSQKAQIAEVGHECIGFLTQKEMYLWARKIMGTEYHTSTNVEEMGRLSSSHGQNNLFLSPGF